MTWAAPETAGANPDDCGNMEAIIEGKGGHRPSR